MGASRERMSAERLFEATEAALRAATELAFSNRGFSPYPADLVGMPEQPMSLEGFTKFEIEEACAFLVRLGVLSKPRRVG
jgi:hypothetical protein